MRIEDDTIYVDSAYEQFEVSADTFWRINAGNIKIVKELGVSFSDFFNKES
jgi:hypothetical protein